MAGMLAVLVAGTGVILGVGISSGGFILYRSPAPERGRPAPDFELLDLRGDSISLAEQRGKNVLINFWATWCAPCREEMPYLQSRFELFKDDLLILAVNFDETELQIAPFVEELGLTFPVLLDPGGIVQDLYQILGYPTTFFIDREGIIRVVHVGVMSEEKLTSYLEILGLGQ